MSSIVLKKTKGPTTVSRSRIREAVSAAYAQNTEASPSIVVTITKKAPKKKSAQ